MHSWDLTVLYIQDQQEETQLQASPRQIVHFDPRCGYLHRGDLSIRSTLIWCCRRLRPITPGLPPQGQSHSDSIVCGVTDEGLVETSFKCH